MWKMDRSSGFMPGCSLASIEMGLHHSNDLPDQGNYGDEDSNAADYCRPCIRQISIYAACSIVEFQT
jgi:hypothetical protein